MTNQSSFASRDYRRLIAAIVLALLIGAGAGYFGSIASGARQSTATSVITSTVTSTTTQFPCSQKPLQESFNSYASRNGTGIAEIDYPVLLLAPGSEGTLCVNPPNPSYSSVVRSYSVFDAANASQISKGISLTESPLNATIPPYGNATVIYTVKASNSSSGAYGIVETRVCGSYPLIVSNNASRWSFADFPGLLDTLTTPIGLCPPWHLFYGKIVGFGGLNMVYLRYKMKFAIPFHETSRSIQSVVVSPTEQNITIKLGIESYAIPVRVGQPSPGSLNDWYYLAHWSGNPQLSPTPRDACDWKVGNSSVVGQDADLFLPIYGVVVSAPTLNLAPYSNGTYTLSIEISNLTQGTAGPYGSPTYVRGGYFATLLSALVTWDGGVRGSSGYATLDLSIFLPVGKIGESASGPCTVGRGLWTNVPWYFSGISF